MEQQSWIKDAAGALAFETTACRLVVKQVSGLTRFLVFRQPPKTNGMAQLYGSGTSENVNAAMAGALKMANRLAQTADKA